MKLKKIASLMLAGIMAVSMLTACDTTSDGNDTGNGEPPVIDTTPTGYSATILSGTNLHTKDLMTAEDSDMLSNAVVAAGESINEGYIIQQLQDMDGELIGSSLVAEGVVNTFDRNLATDVDLQKWDFDGNHFNVVDGGKYAGLYAFSLDPQESDVNGAVSATVQDIMKDLSDHYGQTTVAYTLSVAKAQVGTVAHGVILVGIMVEVVPTHAA